MQALRDMKYSGRGICIGATPSGDSFLAYTLTGRSPSSQARKLVLGEPTQTIRTEVTDPEQLAKGSAALLIYPAIAPIRCGLVASNGAQTELILSTMNRLLGLRNPEEILRTAFRVPQFRYDPGNGRTGDRWIDLTTYEPDDPNFTPRISGILMDDEGTYLLRDVKAVLHSVSRGWEGQKNERYSHFALEPGKGQMLTTYAGGNEAPLVPYTEPPFTVSVPENDVGAIADRFYEALRGPTPQDNFRVAVAVALIHQTSARLEYAIRNRSELGE